ncbi:RNA polymerase sigma factor [Actinospongicola halichondriae]|uniref:RNA polymerase sigma factor n=1 Tax=Actinospongicola halichondriae TaxID=3236844 RepID=UPI003D3AB0ED
MTTEMHELVARAQEGDRAAFDELVRRTHADTYTLAYRLCGNEEDARDVVQDAYLRAFKGLKRFRGDAQFTTWMYRITANCANTLMGKRQKHRHDELPETVEDTDLARDPAAQADAMALRHDLSEALDELSPKLRAVVLLRDVYELPHEDIAAELGISETAAKVRLHRARLQLKERLFPRRGEVDRAS